MNHRLAHTMAGILLAGSAMVGTTFAQGTELTGAGSSFTYPIYSKWASLYAQTTGVEVNDQSIGSSGGIRQRSDLTVDFGASDGPMTDEQMAKAQGEPILHIPTVFGAVSITYNLPEVKSPLKLTGDAPANIYLGTITKWNDPNDPQIAALNPGLTLPNEDILVVHRSDGSGTMFTFTDYLNGPRLRAAVAVDGEDAGRPPE